MREHRPLLLPLVLLEGLRHDCICICTCCGRTTAGSAAVAAAYPYTQAAHHPHPHRHLLPQYPPSHHAASAPHAVSAAHTLFLPRCCCCPPNAQNNTPSSPSSSSSLTSNTTTSISPANTIPKFSPLAGSSTLGTLVFVRHSFTSIRGAGVRFVLQCPKLLGHKEPVAAGRVNVRDAAVYDGGFGGTLYLCEVGEEGG